MGQDKLFNKRKADLGRKVGTRRLRRILIVCEGEKTEPNYFKAFPDNPEVYDSLEVEGTGYNTLSLVREAIRLRDEAVRNGQPYIETWCVFDKDSFSDESFFSAIEKARAQNIRCAYSIEAFEIWYLLHFQYCDSQLNRSQYGGKLTELLGRKYRKNDASMYELLLSRQKTAIKHARRLYDEKARLPCREQNPVTLVFRLVERLNGERA